MNSKLSAKNTFKVFIYLALAFVLFAGVIILTNPNVAEFQDRDALDEFNFSSQVAALSHYVFDKCQDSGVFRLVLHLDEGVIYGITSSGAFDSGTLWVNGDIVLREDESRRLVSFFKAPSGYTEIILKPNFGQSEFEPLFLGEQSLIVSMNNLSLINTSIMLGTLFPTIIFFFGISIYLKEYRFFAWSMLFCLMMALRILATDYVIIAEFFPQISWQSIHRIGMISSLGFSAFSSLYVNMFFSGTAKYKGISQWITILTACIFIPFALFYLLAPQSLNTIMPFQILFYTVILAVPVTTLINAIYIMLKDSVKRKLEHGMVISAFFIIILMGIAEVQLSMSGLASNLDLLLMGAMALIFVCAAAFAMNYYDTDFTAKETEMRLVAENAALESLSRMKTEFMANLSHEIKTPLTVVLGDIQRIGREARKQGVESERISESINRAKDEIMRMARLTESAIKMAALQEEKATVLDSASLFVTAAEGYRSIIEKQGNALIITAEENLPPVYGNADQLIGVLSNLLTNANKHISKGEIIVNIEAKERFISVTVKDNGVGIPPDIIPHVFERGVSGSGSTGMGLAICKNTVESHGGTIRINSEIGKGTEVVFKIPIFNKERLVEADV